MEMNYTYFLKLLRELHELISITYLEHTWILRLINLSLHASYCFKKIKYEGIEKQDYIGWEPVGGVVIVETETCKSTWT